MELTRKYQKKELASSENVHFIAFTKFCPQEKMRELHITSEKFTSYLKPFYKKIHTLEHYIYLKTVVYTIRGHGSLRCSPMKYSHFMILIVQHRILIHRKPKPPSEVEEAIPHRILTNLKLWFSIIRTST